MCDWLTLAGPTGQADLYAVRPRRAVLGLADKEADHLTQLAAVLAVGARMVWPIAAQALHARLPAAVRERIDLVPDWRSPAVDFDVALLHGDPATILSTQQALATRPGPIVTLTALAPGALDIPLERLVTERSLSINTAAAGGNASLMAID